MEKSDGHHLYQLRGGTSSHPPTYCLGEHHVFLSPRMLLLLPTHPPTHPPMYLLVVLGEGLGLDDISHGARREEERGGSSRERGGAGRGAVGVV